MSASNITVCDLHCAPAVQSQTLKYRDTKLEEEDKEKHEEVERTVTSETNKYHKPINIAMHQL